MKFNLLIRAAAVAAVFFTFSACSDDDDTGSQPAAQACLIQRTTTFSLTYDTTYQVDYTYDSLGRKSKIIENDNQGWITLEYNSFGKLSRVFFGVNSHDTYYYDSRNLLTRIVETRSFNTGVSDSIRVTSFKYDSHNRIIEAYINYRGVQEITVETYTYDKNNNVRRFVRKYLTGNNPDEIWDFTYDNKINPFKFTLMPIRGYSYIGFPYRNLSQNNPLTMKISNTRNNITNEYVYNYQYNQQGYPIEERFSNLHNITSPADQIFRIEYTCQ